MCSFFNFRSFRWYDFLLSAGLKMCQMHETRSQQNKLQCIHLRTSLLWRTTIERQACASLNRRKRMKA